MRLPYFMRLRKFLERRERRLFWKQVEADYAALQADPEAWAEYLEEQAVWDNTLMDDLEDDPWPLDEMEPVQPNCQNGDGALSDH